jgi:peptide/nickel transport system ATP-binding protein
MTPTSITPILQLDGVDFSYGVHRLGSHQTAKVLTDISLSLHASETLGVVGESGSGKSTLARVGLGLHRPTAGRVLFNGSPLTRRSRRALRGQRQVVLQTPEWSLNPRLKCGTSIAEPLVVEGVGSRRERRALVAELLVQVGLPDAVANRFPHELSGGQQQRVAIARALATRPRLLVLDEVISALDVSVQAQILNLLLSLQEDQGFASMFISHNLAVVRYVAHRIAVLYAGRLVELAPAAVFYSSAAHPYSRTLQLAHMNVSDTRFKLRESLNLISEGCVLADRCPLALDRCHREVPALRAVGASMVACHRGEEVLRADFAGAAAPQ